MNSPKMIKRLALDAVHGALAVVRRTLGAALYPRHLVHVYVGGVDAPEFERRLKHFVPDLLGRLRYMQKPGAYMLLSPAPVIVVDSTAMSPVAHKLLGHINLDHRHHAHDAWQWFELAQRLD